MIVSVLTQYRLLKFIAINVSISSSVRLSLTILHQCNKEIQQLHMSLRSLRIGTYVAANAAQEHPENRYYPIATATLDTPVFVVF